MFCNTGIYLLASGQNHDFFTLSYTFPTTQMCPTTTVIKESANIGAEKCIIFGFLAVKVEFRLNLLGSG